MSNKFIHNTEIKNYIAGFLDASKVIKFYKDSEGNFQIYVNMMFNHHNNNKLYGFLDQILLELNCKYNVDYRESSKLLYVERNENIKNILEWINDDLYVESKKGKYILNEYLSNVPISKNIEKHYSTIDELLSDFNQDLDIDYDKKEPFKIKQKENVELVPDSYIAGVFDSVGKLSFHIYETEYDTKTGYNISPTVKFSRANMPELFWNLIENWLQQNNIEYTMKTQNNVKTIRIGNKEDIRKFFEIIYVYSVRYPKQIDCYMNRIILQNHTQLTKREFILNLEYIFNNLNINNRNRKYTIEYFKQKWGI